MSANSRTSPQVEHAQGTTQTITGWAAQQWNGVIKLHGGIDADEKDLIVATTAVAVIAIIGHAWWDIQPSVFDAGTIGAGDGMSGVQQAGRYKGRRPSDDVTLSNPEIQALFQNDQILKLVQSDVFREVMKQRRIQGAACRAKRSIS